MYPPGHYWKIVFLIRVDSIKGNVIIFYFSKIIFQLSQSLASCWSLGNYITTFFLIKPLFLLNPVTNWDQCMFTLRNLLRSLVGMQQSSLFVMPNCAMSMPESSSSLSNPWMLLKICIKSKKSYLAMVPV